MTKWRTYRLGELGASRKYAFATGPFGSSISKKFFVDDGVPVIRGSNLSADVGVPLNEEAFVFIEEERAQKFSRSIARCGDLVFTCWGTVGQVGLISDATKYERYIVSNKQMKLTPDTSRVQPLFLYYLLSSPRMVHEVTSQAIGTSVPGFNLGQLKNITVHIPPLAIQERISQTIRTLDDLIGNNRRRIEILEDMARLLYREWFVHFRFPGHDDTQLVDSDLGPIPEGWVWRNLFDLAEVGFGFSFKSRRFTESGPVRVVRIRDLPKNTTTTYTDENPGERYEIHDGDSLIGMDGDFHMCRWADGLAHLNQRVARIRSKGQLSQLHLHLALEQPIREFNKTIIGTTVAHLGKRHLQEIFIAEPPSPVLSAATQRFQPISELEPILRKQNQALREARDLLLPRLVSGELDVSKLDLDLVAL